MAKRVYELVLKATDKASVGRDEYVYRYGNTRDISMRIGKKGVSIRASIGYKEEPVDLLEKDLFKDGVRKALTLFLIKNSEPLRIGSMKQLADGDVLQHRLYRKGDIVPASLLVTESLVRPVPDAFKDRVFIEKYLRRPKSKRVHMDASLDAYLVSKSKVMESERFLYLWMAFNGMYLKLSSSHVERDKLTAFHKLRGTGNGSLKQEKRDRAALAFIRSVKSAQLSQAEFLDIASAVIKDNADARASGITPEGLAMVELGYYLRCKLFHANVPVLFAACASDYEICVLRNVSDLLEEFIDNNLVDWYLAESGADDEQ